MRMNLAGASVIAQRAPRTRLSIFTRAALSPFWGTPTFIARKRDWGDPRYLGPVLPARSITQQITPKERKVTRTITTLTCNRYRSSQCEAAELLRQPRNPALHRVENGGKHKRFGLTSCINESNSIAS